MENQQFPPASGGLDNFFNIVFDETTRSQVRKAAQWARISALCAFIGYGVALIVAIFARQTTLSLDGEENVRVNSFAHVGTILGAIISAGIGVFINYFLYRFATATAKGMDAMDSLATNVGFDGLRVYFKILGILLIIGLSFAGIAILFAIIGAGMGRR